MPARPRLRNFDDALNAVDGASTGHARALMGIIKGEFMSIHPNLQASLNEFKEEASRKFHALQDQAYDASKRAANKVDQEAHRQPWIFVGVAAIFAGIFGFFLGWKARR